MFGAIVKMELKYDSRDLLFRIDDQLKLHGISHFNKIDGNKLRGFGDAGMGIFEMERKEDSDLTYKLFIDANNQSSAQILENIVYLTFDKMEEEGINEDLFFEQNTFIKKEIKEDCSHGYHDFQIEKEDLIFGIPVAVHICSLCNKIELYKVERSDKE